MRAQFQFPILFTAFFKLLKWLDSGFSLEITRCFLCPGTVFCHRQSMSPSVFWFILPTFSLRFFLFTQEWKSSLTEWVLKYFHKIYHQTNNTDEQTSLRNTVSSCKEIRMTNRRMGLKGDYTFGHRFTKRKHSPHAIQRPHNWANIGKYCLEAAYKW